MAERLLTVLMAVLWAGAGAYCIRRLLLKKSSGETAFRISLREVLFSIFLVFLAHFSLPYLFIITFGKLNMLPMHSGLLASFLGQLFTLAVLFSLLKTLDSPPEFLGRGKGGMFRPLFTGAFYLAGVLLLVFVSAALWKRGLEFFGLNAEMQDTVALISSVKEPVFKAVLGLSILVLAPVWEEIFFRAGVYGALKFVMGAWPAAIISSVIFGLIHFSLFAFFPITLLGLFLAILYEKFGDIRVSIGAHAMFNLINLILAVYVPQLSDI